MTVIAVPKAPPIICPSWCTVTRVKHADDLVETEGTVLHLSVDVDSRTLPAAALQLSTYRDGTPLPGEQLRIYLNEAAANIDGLLPVDAAHLADDIRIAVEAARA